MTDSRFNHISGSPYSFTSSQFWCPTCRRSFSQLNLGSSHVNCPRCDSLSEEVHSTPSTGSNQTGPNSLNTSFGNSNSWEDITDNQSNVSQFHETVTSENIPDDFNNNISEEPMNTNNANNNDSQQPRTRPAMSFADIFLLAGAGVPVLLIDPETRHIMIIEFFEANPNGNGAPPASQEELEKLEEFKYVPKGMEIEESCPICMDSYKEEDTLVRLHCKHDYHKECVVKWLTQHNACPMCRQTI